MPELNTIDSIYVQEKKDIQEDYANRQKTYDSKLYFQKMNNLKKEYEFKTDSIKETYNGTGS